MINPNYSTPPNPNLLPPNGNVQPPHEWLQTENAINVALKRIHDSTKEEQATILQNQAKYNHLDPALQAEILKGALKGRDFAAERQVDIDVIRDIARKENTEELLILLCGERVRTANERRQVDSGARDAHAKHQAAAREDEAHSVNHERLNRARAAQGPVPNEPTKKQKDRHQALTTERLHHRGELVVDPGNPDQVGLRVPVVGGILNSHANYAFNIPGWVELNREEKGLTDLLLQYDEAVRQRKLEDIMVNRPYAISSSAEVMARGAAERADQNRAKLGEYDTIVDDLFTEINDRRQNAVANFTTANNTLNTAFENWNLGEAPLNHHNRTDVQDALLNMNQKALQELSPRDPAYRLAFTRFVQQTVRAEERTILEYANDPHAPAPTSEFTPDGGVLMHRGTPSEAVFFSDGSTARDEVGGAAIEDWTRRNAAGQEINPGPREGWPTITEQLGREPLQDIFNAWERCRSPETAARLHAELGFHTDRLQAQEHSHLSTLETISDRITELDKIMIDQGRIATDSSRSPEDQQAARDEIARAAAEKGTLTIDQTRTQRNLEDTHASLTPLLYHRLRLTAVNDGRKDTPTMTTTGAVFQNMALYNKDANGGRGGIENREWALLPDGRTVYPQIDPTTGRVVIWKVYNPDGSFRENTHTF